MQLLLDHGASYSDLFTSRDHMVRTLRSNGHANTAMVLQDHRQGLAKAVAANDGAEVLHLIGVGVQHWVFVSATIMPTGPPLHMACSKGYVDIVKMILRVGAHYADGWKGQRDETPLHIAASQGHTDIIKMLLKAKAGVDGKNSEGVDALGMAVRNGHIDSAKLLLATGGANPKNTRDSKFGMTTLPFAASRNSDDILKLILIRSVSVDVTNFAGSTPLHVAANTNCPSSVRFLLAHQANTNATTNTGVSVLHLALAGGSVKVIEELLKDRRLDVNTICTWGNEPDTTALHMAAKAGYVEIALLLCKHGADVFAKTASGKMPIDLAKDNAQAPVAAYLEREMFFAERRRSDGLVAGNHSLDLPHRRASFAGRPAEDESARRGRASPLSVPQDHVRASSIPLTAPTGQGWHGDVSSMGAPVIQGNASAQNIVYHFYSTQPPPQQWARDPP